MIIDEPETPWASPPKELFEDPEGEGDGGGGGGGGGGAAPTVAGVAMDDVAAGVVHSPIRPFVQSQSHNKKLR